jgi:hypothetical protein
LESCSIDGFASRRFIDRKTNDGMSPIPEGSPDLSRRDKHSTMLLLGSGLVGLVGYGKGQMKKLSSPQIAKGLHKSIKCSLIYQDKLYSKLEGLRGELKCHRPR